METLYKDIIVIICSFLDWKSILSFKQTNKKIYEIIINDSLDIVPNNIIFYINDNKRIILLSDQLDDPILLRYTLLASLEWPENISLNTKHLLTLSKKVDPKYIDPYDLYYHIFKTNIPHKIHIINDLYYINDDVKYIYCIKGILENKTQQSQSSQLYLNNIICGFIPGDYRLYRLLNFYIRKHEKYLNFIYIEDFLNALKYLYDNLQTDDYSIKIINTICSYMIPNTKILKLVIDRLGLKIDNISFSNIYFNNKNNRNVLDLVSNDSLDFNLILEKVCNRNKRTRDHCISDNYLLEKGAFCCNNCHFKKSKLYKVR